MGDYISRQSAIEAVEKCQQYKVSKEDYAVDFAEVKTALMLLPSADVVEADKAQKEIDYWHDKAQSYEQTILKLTLNKADVIEVVRCADCKWHEAINNDDHGWCKMISDLPIGPSVRYDDDYCSFGERADK